MHVPFAQTAGTIADAGFLSDIARSLLALAGVALLFLLGARWLSNRRVGSLSRWDSAVRVLRGIPLEGRKHLYLVRVADRVLLIGTGESGAPTLLADVDPEALDRASA